jgi:L-lactate dehydrogenase complex protein LldE
VSAGREDVQGGAEGRGGRPVRAQLFVTCMVDLVRPEVGEAAVRVLERQGVEVAFPEAQTCCGQFAFNAGYVREAAAMARALLRAFPGDEPVVCPSGSCAAMVRRRYPDLLSGAEREAAERLAERVWELSGFLRHVLGREDLGASLPQPLRAAYHASCHLERELSAGADPRALLGRVRGLELREIPEGDQCCGFGGTFSLTMAEASTAMADAKLEHFASTGCDALVAADLGCLLHLEGRMARRGCPLRALHVAQVLDHATAG